MLTPNSETKAVNSNESKVDSFVNHQFGGGNIVKSSPGWPCYFIFCFK